MIFLSTPDCSAARIALFSFATASEALSRAHVHAFDMEEGADQPADPSWDKPVDGEEQKHFDAFSL